MHHYLAVEVASTVLIQQADLRYLHQDVQLLVVIPARFLEQLQPPLHALVFDPRDPLLSSQVHCKLKKFHSSPNEFDPALH